MIDNVNKITLLIGGARHDIKLEKPLLAVVRGNQTPGEVVNNDWTPTSLPRSRHRDDETGAKTAPQTPKLYGDVQFYDADCR